jgi:hypothetical protein
MTDQEPQTLNPMSWFYATTRPKADTRQMQYDEHDNGAQQQYYLSTARPVPHPCQNPNSTGNFAAPYVTMNFTGNYGNTAAGGCDVDLYSRLILGDEHTQREKGHQQTFARGFSSTPFMKGAGAPVDKKDVESKLIQSLPIRGRKECTTVTDKFFSNQFDPLIPSIKEDIKTMAGWTAPEDWIRGGAPSRILRQQIEPTN